MCDFSSEGIHAKTLMHLEKFVSHGHAFEEQILLIDFLKKKLGISETSQADA